MSKKFKLSQWKRDHLSLINILSVCKLLEIVVEIDINYEHVLLLETVRYNEWEVMEWGGRHVTKFKVVR